MALFNVYPRYDVTPIHAKGVHIYDEENNKYLDLYGGHGVISIGHTNPHYVKRVEAQLENIGFYSNSVNIPIQQELSQKLGQISGYSDHNLFLCNSGAEAVENALKLASFHTGKKKIIAFKKSFHGRTGAALNVTDNPVLSAPLNISNFPVEWIDLNDKSQLENALKKGDAAAVIVEGIQGVGGLDAPSNEFLKFLAKECKKNNTLLILDEIQSGFGRTGKFFAHQHAGVEADIITMAKGMGNGFPIGGILISPDIEPWFGMLGTTFGGNHLACAASLAVIEVLKDQDLINKSEILGNKLLHELNNIDQIQNVKGKGLMLGVQLNEPAKNVRSKLLFNHRIFTGASSNPYQLRILPPLCIQEDHINEFINALKETIK